METWEAIRTVRVVRRFAERPLAPEHVERILHAARRTGSSKNEQRWAFIVCRDGERLRQLSEAGPYAGHLAHAPLAIALLSPAGADRWDLGRAAQNMVLAAWELAIGSCPVTVYDTDLVKSLLGYPGDQDCRYLLAFGHPADPDVLARPNRPGRRKRLDEIVHEERWGERPATGR